MTRVLAVWVATVALAAAADPPAAGTNPGQVLPGPFSAYVVAGGEKAPVRKTIFSAEEKVFTEERRNFADPTRVGKHADFVTRFGLDPTVAVLTREAPAEDSPVGKLLKQLDEAASKNKNARLHAFAIFLRLKDGFLKDDDRIPQVKAIEQFAAKTEIKVTPLALDEEKSARTDLWKIGSDDQTVVVVYENLKVKAKFTYTAEKPLDDAGITAILTEVHKVIKK